MKQTPNSKNSTQKKVRNKSEIQNMQLSDEEWLKQVHEGCACSDSDYEKNSPKK